MTARQEAEDKVRERGMPPNAIIRWSEELDQRGTRDAENDIELPDRGSRQEAR